MSTHQTLDSSLEKEDLNLNAKPHLAFILFFSILISMSAQNASSTTLKKDLPSPVPNELLEMYKVHRLNPGGDAGELYVEFERIPKNMGVRQYWNCKQELINAEPSCLTISKEKAKKMVVVFFESIKEDIQTRLQVRKFEKVPISQKVNEWFDSKNAEPDTSPWNYCESIVDYYGHSKYFSIVKNQYRWFFHLGQPD